MSTYSLLSVVMDPFKFIEFITQSGILGSVVMPGLGTFLEFLDLPKESTSREP